MMNNTTIATVNSASFDMTALMNMLKDSKATIIIINNNGNPIDMTNVVDSTATEVKKKHTFNYHNFCVGRVKQILRQHDIKVKTGMGGAKRGHISNGAFNKFVLQLETKETSLKRIQFLFNALDEAGYTQEGRGLKNDVLFELLDYIKENNLAAKNNNYCKKGQTQYELDNLVEKLVKIPFTNDFALKFSNCLREEDEVAYATFELAEEKATA